MEQLRIVVVEDHPLYRKALGTLIANTPDFTFAGEAADGRQAVAVALDVLPDVVLMDLQLPNQSGFDAIRAIISASATTKILVISLFQDDDSVFAALRAGARGYILKDADETEIVRAIRAIGAGESLFSPAIAGRVLAYLTNPQPIAAHIFPSLTNRERSILGLLARGLSNSAIAGEMDLSPKTIANNVSNIFGKLQVADRAEAIVRARQAGFGE